MYYVRKIDEPTVIFGFGHAEPGKYVFDPAIFEEVEGDLPEGATFYSPPPSLKQRLRAILDMATTPDVPVALRAAVRQIRLAVDSALDEGAEDEAQLMIEQFDAPPEFADVKAAMLAEFGA